MRRRAGESGQALVLALVVLLLASLAASLVATDLMLRERAMRDEAIRAHLRAQLDGALAEALARLDHGGSLGESLAWSTPGGIEARSGAKLARRRPGDRLDIELWATWAGRPAAAAADVYAPPGGTPRVVAWRRLPASAAAAIQD